MIPKLRRSSDRTRGTFQGMRDFFVRIVRRQTHFSLASSALAAVLVITMAFDLVVGHRHMQHAVIVTWMSSYIVLSLIPLWFGSRYPRVAGLVFIGYLTFWSAYSLTTAVHAHAFLNALFEAPMIGLYLGWFYRGKLARVMLAGYLLVLSCAVFVFDTPPDYEFSPRVVLVYAILISIFCLETGLHLHRRSKQQAMTDPLTGVLNRRGLNTLVQPILERAQVDGRSFSFFVVDFDDFKSINDSRGHAAGDDALRDFGNVCRDALGRGDLVARVGGDEFALVLHGDPAEARSLVEQIRDRTEAQWSWGQALYQPGDGLDGLFRRADQALYHRKTAREM